MSDIAHHVSTTGHYSLEFETRGTYSFLSIHFWKKDTLRVVKLFRYRTASEPAAGVLMANSRLLSVLSTQPQIVSVSGCPAELIPVLEHSSYFEKGVEYPFRFDALSLPNKMHERWGSVFGAVSSFSQLKFLIALLVGSAEQSWASLMPEFIKVAILYFRPRVQFYALVSSFIPFVGKLLMQVEVVAVPTICSELLANWKSVHQYLSKIAPPQVNQGVISRPQSLDWEIINDDFFP